MARIRHQRDRHVQMLIMISSPDVMEIRAAVGSGFNDNDSLTRVDSRKSQTYELRVKCIQFFVRDVWDFRDQETTTNSFELMLYVIDSCP